MSIFFSDRVTLSPLSPRALSMRRHSTEVYQGEKTTEFSNFRAKIDND